MYSSYSRVLKLPCIHLTPGSWNYFASNLLRTPRVLYFLCIQYLYPWNYLYPSDSRILELFCIKLTPISTGFCIFSVSSICIPGIICIHLTPGSWNYFVSNLLRFPRVLYFLCIQYLYSGIICIYLTGVLNITLYNIKSGVLKK